MITIEPVIITEGRYDKSKLSGIFDTLILTCEGFSIFKNQRMIELLRQFAKTRGILVLTDSDAAGFLIRNNINSQVQQGTVYHAYIPDIYGKESRKKERSAEGKLGVEGVPNEVIIQAVRQAGVAMDGLQTPKTQTQLKKSDLYALGLSGTEGSKARREKLLLLLSLPEHLSTNALAKTLGALMSYEQLKRLTDQL